MSIMFYLQFLEKVKGNESKKWNTGGDDSSWKHSSQTRSVIHFNNPPFWCLIVNSDATGDLHQSASSFQRAPLPPHRGVGGLWGVKGLTRRARLQIDMFYVEMKFFLFFFCGSERSLEQKSRPWLSGGKTAPATKLHEEKVVQSATAE